MRYISETWRGRKKLLIFAHTFHRTSLTGRTDRGAAQWIYSHHLRTALKFDAQALKRENRDVQEFEDVRGAFTTEESPATTIPERHSE